MTVADLDLVTVYCDGDTDLMSLALGCVLAYDVEVACEGTPHVDLTRDMETAAGRMTDPDYDSDEDGHPGTDAVIAYLKANRHLFQ